MTFDFLAMFASLCYKQGMHSEYGVAMSMDFENDFFTAMTEAIFGNVVGIAFFSTFVYFSLNGGLIAGILGAMTIGLVFALVFGFAASMLFVVVYGMVKGCLLGRNTIARHKQSTLKKAIHV